MKDRLTIATRGSRLALRQSEWVAEAIRRSNPEVRVQLKVIRTAGDRLQNEKPASGPLPKGLFTREIEADLLKGGSDLAVHSFKDLPVEGPEGLMIGAVPERASVHDVLVTVKGLSVDLLSEGAVISTCSRRRGLQWLARYPGSRIEPIRGNVDTRLQKLKEGKCGDGLLLAAAGLQRLDFSDASLEVTGLPLEWMLPAPAQGALAVQARQGDGETLSLVKKIDHEKSRRGAEAERSFLAAMGGGCQAALGALASEAGPGVMRLTGVYFSAEAESGRREFVEGSLSDSALLGQKLAEVYR